MAEIRYTETAVIAALPETVFDYRLDFENLPDYNPHVSNLRRVDGGHEPGPGAEYLFDLTLPGAGTIESPMRVLEMLKPSFIVLETGPGYIAREMCRFTRVAGGTRVELDLTLAFPGEVDDATTKALETQGREQLRLELDLMRKRLEG